MYVGGQTQATSSDLFDQLTCVMLSITPSVPKRLPLNDMNLFMPQTDTVTNLSSCELVGSVHYGTLPQELFRFGHQDKFWFSCFLH